MNRPIIGHIASKYCAGFFLMLLLAFTASCGGDGFGSIQGVVRLQNQTDFEGIEVFIPGTGYRAITDAEGAYVINGVTPGDYTLVATDEGFIEQRASVSVRKGRRAEVGALTLAVYREPAGAVTGYIVAEGAETHENVIVMLVGSPHSAMTSSTGYYQLDNIPPGEYVLLAFKEGWLPGSREGLIVRDQETAEIDEITLQSAVAELPEIEPEIPHLGGLMIRGGAFLQGESSHHGIRVSLLEVPAKYTVTNATGTFIMHGLDEGPYTVVFSRPGFLETRIPDVRPYPTSENRSVGFITLQREFSPDRVGILQGRVYLEDRTEHANTIVRLMGVSQSVVTDANGRYMFIGVPEGEYALLAEHPGFEAGRLDGLRVSPEVIEQATDLTLAASAELEEEGYGAIHGTALLEGQEDHGGVSVAIEGTSFIALTNALGEFRLDNVPYGAYTLMFSKGGYTNEYFPGVNVDVDEITQIETVVLRRDIEPPYVVETFPRNGARQVPVVEWVDVLVRFSERMDGGSVKSAVMIEPAVAYDAFFNRESEFSDSDTLHLRLYRGADPAARFNTTYRITILPMAMSPQGVPMEQSFQFSFTTDGALFTGTLPADGDQGFIQTVANALIIETNAPVDPESFQRSIRFRPRPDSVPQYQFQAHGTGGLILIHTTLRANTRYQIVINNTVRSIHGDRFSNAPYSYSFRTASMSTRQLRR